AMQEDELAAIGPNHHVIDLVSRFLEFIAGVDAADLRKRAEQVGISIMLLHAPYAIFIQRPQARVIQSPQGAVAVVRPQGGQAPVGDGWHGLLAPWALYRLRIAATALAVRHGLLSADVALPGGLVLLEDDQVLSRVLRARALLPVIGAGTAR